MTVLGVVTITSIFYLILTLVWVYKVEDYLEGQDRIRHEGGN